MPVKILSLENNFWENHKFDETRERIEIIMLRIEIIISQIKISSFESGMNYDKSWGYSLQQS